MQCFKWCGAYESLHSLIDDLRRLQTKKSTPVRFVLILVCVSATHLWLAATPLSLPGAGTVYSDILGLIVLHILNMTRTITRIRGLTLYRAS
jgi:hypothetical protein